MEIRFKHVIIGLFTIIIGVGAALAAMSDDSSGADNGSSDYDSI